MKRVSLAMLMLMLAGWLIAAVPVVAQTPTAQPAGPHHGPRLHPVWPPSQPLALKFGFLGCNRIPIREAWQQQGGFRGYTANRAHLLQSARDLRGLDASFLFLAGDLIMGEEEDDCTVKYQLDAWSRGWQAMDVPLPLYFTPGNHEMVFSNGDGEFPNPASGDQYRAWLSEHPDYNEGIVPGPRPDSTYPGAEVDGLVDDQSAMSYYVDVPTPLLRDPRFPEARAIRIVALNTDTLTDLPLSSGKHHGTGRSPWNWLTWVVATAQDDPNIGGIIVMGHRPIARVGKEEFEMDSLDGQRIYTLLNGAISSPSNPGGKVRFYLAAHAHRHEVGQLTGPADNIVRQNSIVGRKLGLYEIVAGCGGSPLEKGWAEHPSWGPGLPPVGIPYSNAKGHSTLQPYFGFQLVTVAVDGTTEVFNFGRPIRTPYARKTYFRGPTEPARVLSSVIVYP